MRRNIVMLISVLILTGIVGISSLIVAGYIHDDLHRVSCWIIEANAGVGIPCLPDNEVVNVN